MGMNKMTGSDLDAWLAENDTMMNLSLEQCNNIITMLEKDNQLLYAVDDKLFRGFKVLNNNQDNVPVITLENDNDFEKTGDILEDLSSVIDRAMNSDFIQNGIYSGAVNTTSETALYDMYTTQMTYADNIEDIMDAALAYHYVISFPDNDGVREDIAFQAVKEMASRMCGTEFQAVYGLQNENGNLSGHICVNSIGAKHGIRFHHSTENIDKTMQPTLDQICKQYNVVDESKYINEKIVSTTIDECIDLACDISYDEINRLDILTNEVSYKEPFKYMKMVAARAKMSNVDDTLRQAFKQTVYYKKTLAAMLHEPSVSVHKKSSKKRGM